MTKGLGHQVRCVLTWGVLLGMAACGSSPGGDGSGGDSGSSADDGGLGGTGGTGGSGGAGASGEGGIGGSPGDSGTPKPNPVIVQIEGVTASTIAGSELAGTQDGTGPDARFNNPVNLVVGPDGNLVVADFDNGSLRLVTPSGAATTLTSQAGFERPFGLAYTPEGNLVAQTDRNPAGEGGTTTGTLWRVDTSTGAATVIQENLGRPRGLAMVDGNRLLMSDLAASWIRGMDLSTGAASLLAGLADTPGFGDGMGVSARFNGPWGAARLPNGNMVVADYGNHAIRVITPAGGVTTLAGNGTPGMVDGELSAARFDRPLDVAVDTAGRVYVSDSGNHRIRRIDVANGQVQTVAGDGTAGFRDGAGQSARFFGQEGIDVSPDGKTLYVADGNGGEPLPYHRVRRLSLP